MNPAWFPFFPVPGVILNFAPLLWNVLAAILIIVYFSFVMVGFAALLLNALTGEYNKNQARVGVYFLLIAAVVFLFHLWLVLAAAALFVIYVAAYWIIWRLILKNILVALGVLKESEPVIRNER